MRCIWYIGHILNIHCNVNRCCYTFCFLDIETVGTSKNTVNKRVPLDTSKYLYQAVGLMGATLLGESSELMKKKRSLCPEYTCEFIQTTNVMP